MDKFKDGLHVLIKSPRVCPDEEISEMWPGLEWSEHAKEPTGLKTLLERDTKDLDL